MCEKCDIEVHLNVNIVVCNLYLHNNNIISVSSRKSSNMISASLLFSADYIIAYLV